MDEVNQVLFAFNRFSLRRSHHTDASGGMMRHHLARMLRGTALFRGEDFALPIVPGDVFYIPYGCRYHSYWSGDEIVWDSFGFTYFPNPENRSYPIQKVQAGPEVLALIDRLAAHPEPDCQAVGLLYTALGQLLPTMQTVSPTKQEQIVLAAEAALKSTPDLTGPALARRCSVSESGLYAAFRRVRQQTPGEVCMRIRLGKACLLLSTTDLSVQAISDACGFHSDVYFYQVFRKEMNMTPRQYRRSHSL